LVKGVTSAKDAEAIYHKVLTAIDDALMKR
jgi:hypothetical protein